MTKLLPVRATSARVALFVDGENMSSTAADRVLQSARRFGDVVICRVYGDVVRLNGWMARPEFFPVHSGIGKNATDMLLSVHATALMLEKAADTLVIAASDQDYRHVATYLRERGATIVGMGEAKAPESFRKACSIFVQLDAPPNPAMATQAKSAVQTQPVIEVSIDRYLLDLIRTDGDQTGLAIAVLGARMNGLYKMKARETSEKTWHAYLLARPELFHCDPKGPSAKVRLKA